MPPRRPWGPGRMPGIARTLSERARAAAAPAADQADAPAAGLATMLDGLRDLVEKLGTLGTETQEAATRGFSLGGKPGRVVFGYTMRTGPGGQASAEPFGHVPEAGASPDRGPGQAAPRQPITDVFLDGADVVVVAEVPGAAAGDVALQVEDQALLIETGGPLPYRKRVALLEAVTPASLRHSCNNGILEVRLARAGTTP